MTARLCAVSAACAVAFLVLGVWVTHHALSRIDVESVAIRGTNLPLAIVLTNSGYGFALSCLGIASIVAAIVLRAPVKIPVAILLSQLLSQGVVELVKRIVARPRPDAWLYHHERGFSFPSGHATSAIVFYGAWLVVTLFAPWPLPVRITAAALIAVWMVGIGWSRVALGAHYPTDVIGGYLLGLAWLCAAIALAGLRAAGISARLA